MLNKIYKKDNKIFRVLKMEDNKLLVIDCVKRSFPIWVDNTFLEGYEVISEEELLKELNIELPKSSSYLSLYNLISLLVLLLNFKSNILFIIYIISFFLLLIPNESVL